MPMTGATVRVAWSCYCSAADRRGVVVGAMTGATTPWLSALPHLFLGRPLSTGAQPFLPVGVG
jgi:hypothetical protein